LSASLEAAGLETAIVPPPIVRAGALRRVRSNAGVVIGAVILALILLIGIAAPLLTPLDPAQINPSYRNKRPGAEATLRNDDGTRRTLTHWMGTDSLGRDIYARVVYGARASLIVGVSVAVISVAVGLLIGLVSRYVRWIDAIAMRIMDGLMAIPAILRAIALVSLSSAGLVTVIIAIVIPEYRESSGWYARWCCRCGKSPTSKQRSRWGRRRRRCSCGTCCPTPFRP